MTAQSNGILVSCECGETFRVSVEFAGREGKCRRCQRALTIPTPGPTDGSMDEIATHDPDLERPPPINDHRHGDQRLDQKESRTRCWRSFRIRLVWSLGLIGGGVFLGFLGLSSYSVLLGGANPVPTRYFFVAACVGAGGVAGLIMCIVEVIVPTTGRIRRLLSYVQVAVIGLVVIVGGIILAIEHRRSEQRRQPLKQFAESLANRGMSTERRSGYDYVVSIAANPAGPPVTDTDLRYLSEHADKLRSLHELNLAGTEITDAGLKHLGGEEGERWQHVAVLNLSRTKVTDAGLECLDGFSHLSVLDLYETRVTDAGLAHLNRCSRLRTLNLANTEVTDAGLEHLNRCSRLRTLNLAGTQVTDAGIEKLRRARSKCKVER